MTNRPLGLSVSQVIDKYLAWCARHRSPRTFQLAAKYLPRFLQSLPPGLPAAKLRPYHVVQWIESHPRWGPNQQRACISVIVRPFNWGAGLGYPGVRYLTGIERPRGKKRAGKLTPEAFQELLAHVPDVPFADLLRFVYESGCRPQEVRQIEARHVHLERHRIEIPPDEAKGKEHWRRIYLSDTALAIVRRLAQQYPSGLIFRNNRGKPWKAMAVISRFARLKKKLGIKFAAYDLRHCFATRKLKEGHDAITVAALLGHKNGKMLCEFYEELSTDDQHLVDAVNRPPQRKGA